MFPNSEGYDDIQENRVVEAVWQSDICHICCPDRSDIIPCILKPIRDSDGNIVETGEYSDNPVSICEFDQKDGNILLS